MFFFLLISFPYFFLFPCYFLLSFFLSVSVIRIDKIKEEGFREEAEDLPDERVQNIRFGAIPGFMRDSGSKKMEKNFSSEKK